MTKTEKIKVMALQGMRNCEIATELGLHRQQVSAALHARPAIFSRGRKRLEPVCRSCGVDLTPENKAKYHRSCKKCANAYAKALKLRG